MNAAMVYLATSILVLAVAGRFLFSFKRAKRRSLTPLAGVAFGFTLAGVFFGSHRTVGYGLLAVGVTLAIIDALRDANRVRGG